MNAQTQATQRRQYFFQGVLLGLLPLTLLFFHLLPSPFSWISLIVNMGSSLLMGIGIAILFRNPVWGKVLFSIGLASSIFLLYPVLCSNPLFALFMGILVIVSLYLLFGTRLIHSPASKKDLDLERFHGAALAQLVLTIFSLLFAMDHRLLSLVALGGSLIMLYSFGGFLFNSLAGKVSKWLLRFLFLLLTLAAIVLAQLEYIILITFIFAFAGIIYAAFSGKKDLKYLNAVINHPGRSLFLTFAFLCAGGTLLLRTPAAMTEEIKVIDAAFTAVSGVCVTGLSTIDIAKELTFTGRCFLLLLIQAGGLGIMTLAAWTLHILGRRLSLDQEQVLAEMTAGPEQDIYQSLKQIVKVTFFCEFFGALLLVPCFYQVHGDWNTAFELGIFTSISAFCNAGFFPGATNLMPYSGEYLLLFITALLIMAGGIAPAVTLSLLQSGRRGRRLPLVSRFVIGSTLLILGVTTLFLLLFEWNGIFRDLTGAGKIVNGFFLAVSLRTAGFNTVGMESSSAISVIIMLLAMFIGGSPGGTAGGVKTTTFAIIVLTLYTAVRGRESVLFDRHRIPGKSIVQAVAIISSAFLVLLAVIIMLAATQSLGARELIFESVSALGTVGLSLGITSALDPVGKIIIMVCMFIGRIGPLTLFLLLSEKYRSQECGYPPIKVPLG